MGIGWITRLKLQGASLLEIEVGEAGYAIPRQKMYSFYFHVVDYRRWKDTWLGMDR